MEAVDEAELSAEEAKERKIMKLLLKVKNGTPPQRKSALRQLTEKARDFGAKALFDQILPLLMTPTLEDQERHLLVKVIDRCVLCVWGGVGVENGGGTVRRSVCLRRLLWCRQVCCVSCVNLRLYLFGSALGYAPAYGSPGCSSCGHMVGAEVALCSSQLALIHCDAGCSSFDVAFY
jgi:hypothetical protein